MKIVIGEAIKGQQQISEIAADYEVHPNQITNWKATGRAGLSKKKLKKMGVMERRKMINIAPDDLSIKQQCSLMDISTSGYYYKPVSMSELNLELMKKIDKIYIENEDSAAQTV